MILPEAKKVLKSKAEYWDEVSKRGGDVNDILMDELRDVLKMVGILGVMFILSEWSKGTTNED